jgi:hypothetical protein
MASGRAPGTSSASTCCGPCSGSLTASVAFLTRCTKAKGADRRLDTFADQLERRLASLSDSDPAARRTIEMMAFALQASLLVRYSYFAFTV